MMELPSGWELARVGDVCDPITKWDPRRSPEIGFTYIDIGGIEGQRIIETKSYVGQDAPSRARQVVHAGDTVLSTVRTYLRKTALVPVELDGATASTGFCVLRPSKAIDARFLFYRVTAHDFAASLSAQQTGSSYPAVRDGDVFAEYIAVPPLAEQRRIVAAIEEQFSRLDATSSDLRKSLATLRQLRASLLARAFASRWPPRAIGDVARVGSGATPLRSRQDYYDGGTIPWVTSGQLNDPYVSRPAAFVTEKALRETALKLWPRETLLVAMYGEGRTRGRCSELLIEAATNQACAAIVLEADSTVDRRYLKLFFTARYDANRLLSAGGVQPNLSLGLIKNMEFPCPPLAEQRRIVAEVEQQLSLIDSLRAAVESAQKRSAALRRAILERAFRGELVPQDPHDEPASVLLERIRAERAAAPARSSRRRANMEAS